jgi:hypothetical protein
MMTAMSLLVALAFPVAAGVLLAGYLWFLGLSIRSEARLIHQSDASSANATTRTIRSG